MIGDSKLVDHDLYGPWGLDSNSLVYSPERLYCCADLVKVLRVSRARHTFC